jgi:phosphoglycerate dehydrogenase-like enzyme
LVDQGGKMIDVALLDDYTGEVGASPHIEALRARARVTVYREPPADEDELVRRLAETEAVMAIRERTRFPARLLERLPRLRFIAQTGNHAYHIDMDAATRLGVAVAVDPRGGARQTGTSELTLGLMIAVMRGVTRYDALLHAGGWEVPRGRVLAGKTLGLVGLGRVGGQVARLALAFGMRVLAWTPRLTDERAAAAGVERAPDLDALMAAADVVSVHVSLSPETVGLIDARRIGLMRRDAVLINTSRGPIVTESALVEALRSGRIAGAAVDVFDREPPPPDHPLRGCPNAVLTPHAGYPTDQAYDLFAASCAYLVGTYLDGRPEGVLNPEALRRA